MKIFMVIYKSSTNEGKTQFGIVNSKQKGGDQV